MSQRGANSRARREAGEQAFLDYLTTYITEHGYAPTLTEASAALGISKTTLVKHTAALAAAGAIIKGDGSRAISLPREEVV